MTKRTAPRFTGFRTYIDPQGRFRFRYPTGWHEFELDNGLEGVMFSPHAAEPQTSFSVWISRLDDAIVAEDLPDLRVGVEEGLAQLAQCRVEDSSERVFGNLIRFERIYTFDDNGVVRKRKVWLLYVDRWRLVVTLQGETVEEYQYWLAMGNYSFHHFTLPPELWFSTDRELVGWRPPATAENGMEG